MKKILVQVIIVIIIIIFALILFFDWRFIGSKQPQFGINFATTRAAYLGFDWQKMYADILTELQPKQMRVMAYWEIIEPEKGKFNFAGIDYVLAEAEKRNIKVILTVGHKQPGWPECHHPAWYESLPESRQQAALIGMLSTAVGHFKSFPAVAAWQVENEPFFVFGPNCPAVPQEVLAKEIALVRSLDNRPVITTDSGEKGTWLRTAKFGDVFGSTMYRTVYQDKMQRYLTYPLPPMFYRVRAGILQTFSRMDKIIGLELQAEPWFASDVFSTPWDKQRELMNAQILAANAEYARKVGFAENYFWGVEWWYYAKEKHNDPSLWNLGKKLLSE